MRWGEQRYSYGQSAVGGVVDADACNPCPTLLPSHSICMADFDTKGIYDVLMDYDFIGENGMEHVCA